MTDEHHAAKSLEKLTVPPPVKEFPGFYKIQIYYCVHNNKPFISIVATLTHCMSPLSQFIRKTHSIEKEKYGIIKLFLTQAFFVISLNVLLNLTPHRFTQQFQLFCNTGCVPFIITLTKEALLQKILHVLGHTVDSCAQVQNKTYINARVFTESHTMQKDVSIVV
jgi:hypothetical protein